MKDIKNAMVSLVTANANVMRESIKESKLPEKEKEKQLEELRDKVRERLYHIIRNYE